MKTLRDFGAPIFTFVSKSYYYHICQSKIGEEIVHRTKNDDVNFHDCMDVYY